MCNSPHDIRNYTITHSPSILTVTAVPNPCPNPLRVVPTPCTQPQSLCVVPNVSAQPLSPRAYPIHRHCAPPYRPAVRASDHITDPSPITDRAAIFPVARCRIAPVVRSPTVRIQPQPTPPSDHPIGLCLPASPSFAHGLYRPCSSIAALCVLTRPVPHYPAPLWPHCPAHCSPLVPALPALPALPAPTPTRPVAPVRALINCRDCCSPVPPTAAIAAALSFRGKLLLLPHAVPALALPRPSGRPCQYCLHRASAASIISTAPLLHCPTVRLHLYRHCHVCRVRAAAGLAVPCHCCAGPAPLPVPVPCVASTVTDRALLPLCRRSTTHG